MGEYRECTACRSRFIAQRVTRRFCSSACRLKWHRAFRNDPSGGKLSLLLRQVADTIDRGQAARGQVARLRSMLSSYHRAMTDIEETELYFAEKRRRTKAVS